MHGTGFSIQIDLTTVQLFDLVEAVDQFFADSQTLPDLSLQLTVLNTAGSSQPLVKQAVPGAVGVSSLALAAIAFSLFQFRKSSVQQKPSQFQSI